MKGSAKVVLSSLLVITFLVGCSNGNSAENSKNISGSDEVQAKVNDVSNEPAEVVFYSNNGLKPEVFDERFGNMLRKKFPNYTIKYIQKTGKETDLPEMMLTNTHFDIFFANVGHFESAVFQYQLEYDMSDLLKKHNVDLNRFDQSIISGVKASSYGMYALPVNTDTMVLYYNKDLFDKFGVPHPTNGMTWDQIYELSKKLTRSEGGTSYLGYGPFNLYDMYVNQLSIPLTDQNTGAPTINKDERWKSFFQTLVIAPSQVPGARDYFINQKGYITDKFMKDKEVAMISYVSALAPVWANEMSQLNWDWVSQPTFKEAPGVGAQPYTYYFGITKLAKNKDAAMQVLKALVSDEFQTEYAKKGIVPILKDPTVRKALGQDTVFKDKNWQAIFYNKMAVVPFKGINDQLIASVYAKYATLVMQDKVDLNTAFRMSEEEANKLIESRKK